jgi:hypothetical protein
MLTNPIDNLFAIYYILILWHRIGILTDMRDEILPSQTSIEHLDAEIELTRRITEGGTEAIGEETPASTTETTVVPVTKDVLDEAEPKKSKPRAPVPKIEPPKDSGKKKPGEHETNPGVRWSGPLVVNPNSRISRGELPSRNKETLAAMRASNALANRPRATSIPKQERNYSPYYPVLFSMFMAKEINVVQLRNHRPSNSQDRAELRKAFHSITEPVGKIKNEDGSEDPVFAERNSAWVGRFLLLQMTLR